MKVILLSSDGSWFHNLGAAAAKALSPRVDRVFTTGGNNLWNLSKYQDILSKVITSFILVT